MNPDVKKQKQTHLKSKLQQLHEFTQKIEAAEKFDYIQLMEKMVETYPEEIFKCVDKGRQMIRDKTKDFYVCSALKREPLTPKIFKQQFFWCFECPRPYLNFTVFKYHRKSDELELIWCLPDRETLNLYYNNRYAAKPEDWALLKYCIEYKDGTLWKKMKELNQESDDKPSLIVHDFSIFH